MALISVIIPAYNAEAWIGDSLGSLLEQTHRDWEAIVVDDGSKDATAEIARKFADPRIKVIQQENAGQSAAANVGVNQAQGEYIKFLDADDGLNSTHLAAQVNALAGTTSHLADCRWCYFVNDVTSTSVRDESTNRDVDDPLAWLVESLSQNEGLMAGWKWLIPRAIIEKAGGWNESLSLNNDFEFSIRLLLHSDGTRFAKDAVYAYRKTLTPTLSGSRGRKAMDSAFLTTKLGCDLLLQRENSDRIRRICADRYQMWLYQFFPEYPDLATQCELAVNELGGSERTIQGGRALQMLLPILGWKNVRRLQTMAYRYGWSSILKRKEADRVSQIESAS